MNELEAMKKLLIQAKAEIEKYRKIYLEDNIINNDEQAKLDELEAKTQTIEDKILELEIENGDLDVLYELVIESNKKAASNPTIENRESYEKILEKFNQKYHDSNKSLQNLWKHAQEESKKQLVALKEKIKKGKDIKVRIDNLERVESAKIYYIIKGLNSDGTEWGRIDFVGANYIPIHENKVPKGFENNLPLVVKYYIYEDGKYKFKKSSNTLESSFDKQLMDIFQKSGRISYEQHSNLGRDYEYSPGLALLYGKGPWYVNLGSMATLGGEEKAVEVPDWNDFGFEDLYDEYLDKCGKGILPPEYRDRLKEDMQESISKQKKLVEELKEFHSRENDRDANTAILVNVWIAKIGAFEEKVKELKENCFEIKTFPQPCKNFEDTFDKHKKLCKKNALPKRVGDDLKDKMQDCIDSDNKLITDKQNEVNKLKKVPNWSSSPTTKAEVEKLEKEIKEEKKTIQEQEDKLAKLSDECIEPVTLEVLFIGGENKIASKNEEQLDKIAQFLIDNPTVNIELIGNTSDDKGKDLDDKTRSGKVDEVIPTGFTPSGLKTCRDLMMIRAHRIKLLFESMGVNKNQLHPKAGENLGSGDENKKLTLKYF